MYFLFVVQNRYGKLFRAKQKHGNLFLITNVIWTKINWEVMLFIIILNAVEYFYILKV